MSTNKHSRNEKGFTLIEMLVVAPIVILAIGAFITVIVSMTGEVIASRASNKLTYDVQNALNRIEQDVKLSTTFLATNSITLNAGNAQGFDDDVINFTNVDYYKGANLILNMVATSANPVSTTSQFVYLKDQPNACANAFDNIPLTYNVVYFVKNESLWRRTIMPTQYADTTNYSCAIPWQQPSCSPTYMDAQSGSVFCKTNDVKLVDGLDETNFTIQYYNGSNQASENTTASDSSALIGTRSTALTSATTIRALISATQQAGGREIDHSSSIRVSRLESNASAIASLSPASIPSAPTISSKTSPGAKAVFNWAAVNGATGYTFQYNINGGAWQTGFTNQNTRTFTVSAPANGDIVNARVQAINSAGTSGYGTTAITIPLWEPLLLTNGWVTFDLTFGVPSYTKTSSGVVLLKGMMKRSAAAVSGQTFAALPDGYRPEGGRLAFGTSMSSNVNARVDVDTNGDLITMTANNAWTSLDPVRFVPGGRYTRTAVTPFLNGWTNYTGAGSYAPASYVQADLNRVFTQGMIVPGTITNGTRMFNLPDAQLPSQYLIMSTQSNGYGLIGADVAGATSGIQAKGVATSYLSVNSNYLNVSQSGWTTPTLLNSWVNYGLGHATAQYVKSSDNLVTLKGLIKSGTTTTNTVLFNLPAGNRPRERLLFATATSGAYARMDILTNGDVILVTGGNTYYSLSGITFVAEL